LTADILVKGIEGGTYHKRGVENKRNKGMENKVERQGHDGREVVNPPGRRSESTEVDHAADHNDDAKVHPLVGLEDEGKLLEEVRVLLLLGCGAPLHVDVEQVS
jgi:hypothetical protein